MRVAGTDRAMPLAEVAHVWYRKPQLLPADVDPGGLEATAGYKAQGRHRHVQLRVPRRRGRGRHRDSVTSRSSTTSIVEDGGTLVNPMIVDGQMLRRPRAGHRHRAVRGDAVRRARASRSPRRSPTTCCPARPRCRRPRSTTWRRRRRYTFFGQKGIGEGGAIAPPAAIANAVNDALAPLGVETRRMRRSRRGASSPTLGLLA